MIGLIGISIPAIIHLINRSRFVPVEWGAMLFLRQAIAVRARRVRLEHIILLILRCALLLFLALALAGPYFTKKRDVPGGGLDRTQPASIAIVLDTSYSMTARIFGQRETRLEKACDAATRLISGLPQGSELTLLMTGQLRPGDKPEPTHNLKKAKETVSAATAGMASLSLTDSIEMAMKVLEHSEHPNREIFVLTDACRHGWNSDRPELWKYLGDERRAMKPDPKVFLVRLVPELDPVPDNLSVEALRLERSLPDTFSPTGFFVGIRNSGRETHSAINVELRVDGKKRSARQVDVKPDEVETLRFNHQFTEAGSHFVEVRIDGDDLPADNSELLAVDVADSLPVLLVDGNPDPMPLRSESGFVRIAVAPPPDNPNASGTLVKPVTIDSSGLAKADLNKFRVVILANVAAIDPDALIRLTSFVRDGGGVLVAPGDRADPEYYNRVLYASGEGLLPCRIGKAKGDESRHDVFGRVSLAGGDHPALSCFGTRGGADISRGRAFKWFPLLAESKIDKQTRCAALVEGSDAFLAEKTSGRGRVILLSVPLNDRWTDFPAHPFYVPLCQSLVQSIAGDAPSQRNVQLGAPLTWISRPGEKFEQCKWELVGPSDENGHPVVGHEGGRTVVEYEKAHAPGLYTILCKEPGKNDRPIHFVVKRDEAEANLAPLQQSTLEPLAKALGAFPVAGWDGLQAAFESHEQRTEWWPLALLGALALALFEVAATNWFSRSEKGPGVVEEKRLQIEN
jgi:hypothetical protein